MDIVEWWLSRAGKFSLCMHCLGIFCDCQLPLCQSSLDHIPDLPRRRLPVGSGEHRRDHRRAVRARRDGSGSVARGEASNGDHGQALRRDADSLEAVQSDDVCILSASGKASSAPDDRQTQREGGRDIQF